MFDFDFVPECPQHICHGTLSDILFYYLLIAIARDVRSFRAIIVTGESSTCAWTYPETLKPSKLSPINPSRPNL